ncbi:MAG: PEGA domain-containing protein [Labilithrix sp.]|nr:PEGA domain-containing protein [Labilithrix sp.]MCW5809991.1 PEGA domain-containing protein [Labilithrix sp.]
MRRALLAVCCFFAALAFAPPAPAQPKDLSRARALDREGAKAYGEGRYADAIRAFDEAYRLGGPPFELWNIAKCHLRLDQPEQAAELLERYLATPNLPKEDREEASAQLDALKKRPSTLTVTSSPAGATVTVDGKEVPGVTPLSVTVMHGSHTVEVSAPTGVPYKQKLEARYGRAVHVVAHLKEGGAERPAPPANPYASDGEGAISVRAALSLVAPRFGSIGGAAGPGFLGLVTVRVAALGRGALAVGGVFTVSGDSWGNESGASNDVASLCAMPNEQSATALGAFGVATAMFPLSSKLKLGGMTGVGFAGLSHDQLGSDVFIASCDPSTGLRPAFLFGAALDYSLGSVFRLSAFPLTWHLQPAFGDTRSFPRDATSVWMRFGVGVGLGVDL